MKKEFESRSNVSLETFNIEYNLNANISFSLENFNKKQSTDDISGIIDDKEMAEYFSYNVDKKLSLYEFKINKKNNDHL